MIHKSKLTISKYENNIISPDVDTLLTICNKFDISFSYFMPNELYEKSNQINPFGSNILYIYYYTNNKLITSVLEIYTIGSELLCHLFNGCNDIKNYQNCAFSYAGKIESNQFLSYISLNNNQTTKKLSISETVLMTIKLNWSNNTNKWRGTIVGVSPNLEPSLKKDFNFDRNN